MRGGSYVFIDTNVCIFRTIANLREPKIYSERLNGLKRYINDITNTNLGCKLIVSDVVYSELKDGKILTREVVCFCENVLRYPKNSYKILAILNATRKSIEKFCDRNYIESGVDELIKGYYKNVIDVDNFYSRFPERLREITERKVGYLSGWRRGVKERQRKDNFPEMSDRLLLCQAIELGKVESVFVGILSNDSDFTCFKDDIMSEFGVEVEDCF